MSGARSGLNGGVASIAQVGQRVICRSRRDEADWRYKVGHTYNVVDFCGNPRVTPEMDLAHPKSIPIPDNGMGYDWELVI